MTVRNDKGIFGDEPQWWNVTISKHKNSSTVLFCTILRYLYFTWVFSFYVTFYFTTFWKPVLYSTTVIFH